jgi:monoamine oxidase
VTQQPEAAPSRRDLLSLIGAVAGSSAMYLAMTSLGFAAESQYNGPIKLDGDPKGASVLILGAGIAGMVVALELRKAGYKVQILDYNAKPGGRTWTIRGGDQYTELGGETQNCQFADGLYINPGPWRIPYHHRGLLDYCKRLGVALEPFIQVNHNAYLHSKNAFAGKPQRYRTIQADFHGTIADLLAKAVNADKLDEAISKDDREQLLASLRSFGGLDADNRYRTGYTSSSRRGFERPPGGGLEGEPKFSEITSSQEVLKSGLWRALAVAQDYDYQTTLFQPVGGMDMIARAFAREVGDLIRQNTKVTKIQQDSTGVTATWTDTKTNETGQTRADWCLCTIPLSILSQIDINVATPMAEAIAAVPYAPGLKIGLQFKRRFWEQDDAIYGGISYTDLPITQIAYPNSGYFNDGPGVLLGAYPFGPYAYEFTALPPAERIRRAVEWGSAIHPQYKAEFEHGMAVGWHRVPGALGCFGAWSQEARRKHYKNLCALDGRIMLAGEHASYIPAWQEGALLSSLDAISRLHKRVMAG